MTTPAHPHEQWRYPVEITTDNNTFQVDEGGGFILVTLTPGVYYHTDSSLHAELLTQLNGTVGLSGVYTLEAVTPSQTSTLGTIGLGIRATGTASLRIRFLGTFPAGIEATWDVFGYSGGDTNGFADGGAGLLLTPAKSPVGTWVPHYRRSFYEPRPQSILQGSTEFTEVATFYSVDYGTRRKRRVVYEYLPSTRVFTDRANIEAYGTQSPAGLFGTGNEFERMWAQMRRGRSVYVTIYDAGEDQSFDDPDLNDGADPPSEEARVSNVADMREMSSLVTLQNLGGEYYRVEFEIVLLQSSYDY